MSDIILNNKEQDVLAGTIESSILTPDDVAKIKTRTDIAQLRAELERVDPNGELLKALKAEIAAANQPQDNFDSIRAIMNGTNAPANIPAPLAGAPTAVETVIVAPVVGSEVKNEDLPVAPVTTFNIIRLMQLGYIPVDKPEKLGVKNSPKWVFYGLNAATQWGNGKIAGIALDWSDKKGGSAYRTMLDADISELNKELKAYQKNTATVFGVKVELEKQLALLESLKSERDHTKTLSLANEYVASRSKTNFSHGAIGYDNPSLRKTTAELDAEINRAEGRATGTEKHIDNAKKDLAAMLGVSKTDSLGKARETEQQIKDRFISNQQKIDQKIGKLQSERSQMHSDLEALPKTGKGVKGTRDFYIAAIAAYDSDIAKLQQDRIKLEASKNKDLHKFEKAKMALEKQIQAAESGLPKRLEREQKIAVLNTEIKTIESKLAGAPTTSERLKLEGDLRELYAQKNAVAHTFTTAIEAKKGRNDSQTQAAAEGQIKEVQKELAKLNQLSTEMDGVKNKIDAIQAEVEAAKTALNNEKDPVKAKKLRDEMPAKINAANSHIFELNQAGAKICTSAGINWKTIPDLELKSVLQRNLLLSKFLAAPQGAIARVESFGQTPGGQKTMKMVYGGLRWVGVAGAARTVGNEMAQGKMKEAGLDAFDAGMGFVGMIPGGNIVSGIYDIGMAGKQFVTGTDINGRNVSTSQSFVRLGFGIVGLIPVVGNIVKGAAAAKGAIKTVSAVEKVESAANLAMKGAVLAQVGTVAYDVVDVTANMFREPVSDVAMRVVRGQEQPGIIFHNSPKK